MDPKFAKLVESLAPKLKALTDMPPLTNGNLPVGMPSSGVYLFSEPDSKHLYVGRSNDLRGRYGRHCRPGATHRQAAFAFRLARIATGHTEATYAQEGGRSWLIALPKFLEAFVAAKEFIRGLEYRYVEETDQNKQALLEIYAAIVLGTPHNDFGTH
jgi:hypothetical protein